MADKVNKKSEKSAARKKASLKFFKDIVKNTILKFFKDIRSELKKVTWLSWPKLVKNTITVIAACLVIGIVIWIFDAAISKVITWSLLR
ncbi:MAG: preprotein translocase subunit SecE [Clostridiaceae bacterium]|jgi:preprotein translocase subunit SecE|nr:preprotein translocase subunit SecE [Clostridiaceae bacterium]